MSPAQESAYKPTKDVETLLTQDTGIRVCSLNKRIPADTDKKRINRATYGEMETTSLDILE